MTMASAPRGTGPPVAIDVAVPDSTGLVRRGAAGDHFIVEDQANGRAFARGSEIGGAHRKTVDIGAVERRHVDRRKDIFRQRAAKRIRQRPLLTGHRPRKQRGFKTRQRLLARQNRQELVLIDAFAAGLRRCLRVGHGKLISLPQHIGIDRRARRKSFGAAGNHKKGFGARNGFQRQFAYRQRRPGALALLQQHNFGNADA